MVGARKMPQSHIHKPPEERNKGSIKYIQSCGEIRSFCCVWWRKGEMAGKRKDQPTLSVSIIWEIVGFHFHRKVKTTWLTSQRVKPVLKGCDCGKMFPLFPSNAPSQHTNTFTSQHTNTFLSHHTNTFHLSTQMILHLPPNRNTLSLGCCVCLCQLQMNSGTVVFAVMFDMWMAECGCLSIICLQQDNRD